MMALQETRIIMEFCDAGSLDEAIQQGRFRSSDADPQGPAIVNLQALCLTLLDIASAMAHLHSMRIVHKDLKPKNVLLATCAVWLCSVECVQAARQYLGAFWPQLDRLMCYGHLKGRSSHRDCTDRFATTISAALHDSPS